MVEVRPTNHYVRATTCELRAWWGRHGHHIRAAPIAARTHRSLRRLVVAGPYRGIRAPLWRTSRSRRVAQKFHTTCTYDPRILGGCVGDPAGVGHCIADGCRRALVPDDHGYSDVPSQLGRTLGRWTRSVRAARAHHPGGQD